MGLKTFVKINSVTNLSDARYCAGMGVDQIGFCINPSSENYVDPQILQDITGWISGVEIVSEMKGLNEEAHTDIVEVNSLDYQLHNDKRIAVHLSINEAEKQLDQLVMFKSMEYLIITGDGEIDEVMTNRITVLSNQIPIVLGFGLNQENVNSIIETTNIKGIALTGSNEIRPGFKDYDELADILEAIEED